MQAILARLASIRIPVKRFTDPEFLSSPMPGQRLGRGAKRSFIAGRSRLRHIHGPA